MKNLKIVIIFCVVISLVACNVSKSTEQQETTEKEVLSTTEVTSTQPVTENSSKTESISPVKLDDDATVNSERWNLLGSGVGLVATDGVYDYVLAGTVDFGELVKINRNTQERQVLLNQFVRNINYCDGWLYFTLGTFQKICKMKTDGTDYRELYIGKDGHVDLTLYKGELYFTDLWSFEFC